jgi:protoporphyrinogen/coproporphyrinogen III oxidase
VAAAPLTIVIGAGISGLTCAYALQKAEQNVMLLEASERPGGVIQSAEEDGYLFELGPQSFSSSPALCNLSDELELTKLLVEAPHGAPRYVLLGGSLAPVPMSPTAFLASSLLGWKTKFAILTEAMRTTYPPEPDESVAAFTRRKFSADLLDRVVGPFVSGIYAGDPEQLSLRAAFPKMYEAERISGSLVRGMLRLAQSAKRTAKETPRRPTLLSFRAGNETLVRSLAEKLGSGLRCNVAVTELSRSNQGFVVRAQTSAGNQELTCQRVVLATPAQTTAQILQNISAQAASPLREIEYAPVAVVSLGYQRRQVRHSLAGFGFLAPRSSTLRILGTVWNSSLFPGRAPQNRALLTSFIGGATDPRAAGLSADELAGLVHRENAAVLGITGNPELKRVTSYLRAIPQYNLGHSKRLKHTQENLAAIPGLSVIGNYWMGPSIGACIEHALAVAEQIRIGYNS